MIHRAFAASILLMATLFGPSEAVPYEKVDLIITNIRLYTAPEVAPLEGVSLAVNDGKVVEIGYDLNARSEQILDAGNRVATAGLWNSHVHFTSPTMKTEPGREIREMLLKYGFTSVFDTGSDLHSTMALSKAIDAGDVPGPRIFMANGSFVFTDGTPSYLPGVQLPEIDHPNQADAMVAEVMDSGVRGIKIFAGSFMSPTETIHLPPDVIQAVANATHERGGLLISHPTDRTGLVQSVENGVDILAHTAPGREPLGDYLITTMLNNEVALVPTLMLWSYELSQQGVPDSVVQQVQDAAVRQVSDYYHAGGTILFGTDTGYMRKFDTREEFNLMHEAGMDFDAILASLTTHPAARIAGESGQLEVGASADMVIYMGDPSQDVLGFSQILYTIRAGKLVYCAETGHPDCPSR